MWNKIWECFFGKKQNMEMAKILNLGTFSATWGFVQSCLDLKCQYTPKYCIECMEHCFGLVSKSRRFQMYCFIGNSGIVKVDYLSFFLLCYNLFYGLKMHVGLLRILICFSFFPAMTHFSHFVFDPGHS